MLSVVPPVSAADSIPDWDALFGSLDFCECEHCRSVLSPAAYLVDLLLFLDKSKAADGNSGLEKLFERRPDLGNIALTCENTNTPLPYIDLVNEVLENVFVPIPYTDHYTNHYWGLLTYPVGVVPQTTGKAEELRANPEHMKAQVYDKFRVLNYPWNLPFNLWGEEAKVYLEHLGVQLSRLMEVFRKQGMSPFEVDIANTWFCLMSEEQRLISGHLDNEFWEYFGLATASDLPQLNDVLTLLKKTGLEYKELLEALKAHFINPTKKELVFAGDSCELKDATLTLDNDELSRLHRFWRLKEKTGWTALQLDKVITAVKPHKFHEDFIIQLYYAQRLFELFPLEHEVMLCWWAELDTSEYENETSYYEQLFLNKSVNNPLSHAFELVNLGNTGDTILSQDMAPVVRSAVNVNAADLHLLVDQELPDDMLNLSNLSHVYRVASFTRALHISIADYFVLKSLSGQQPLTEVNPANIAAPEDTLKFVNTLNFFRNAGFSVEELTYLLRHEAPTASAIPPADQTIAIELSELRTELQKVQTERRNEGTLVRKSVETNLSLLLGSELLDEAMAIIDGTSSETMLTQKTFIDDHLAPFLDVDDAKTQLVDPGTLTDLNDRFDYVDKILLAAFLRNVIVQKLATATNLEAGMTEALLKSWLPHPDDASHTAITAFLDDGFVNSAPDSEINRNLFTPQFKCYEHLHKVGLLSGKLSMQTEDLDFLIARGPVLGWLDIRQLPLDQQAPNLTLEACRRLIQAYNIQRTVFKPTGSLFDLLSDIEKAHVDLNGTIVALHDVTEWAQNDITFLTGSGGYDFVFPNDYKDEQWLQKLADAFAIIKRIGVSAEQIWSWHTFEISANQAVAIRNATKAKYDNEHWLKIASPLRDVLREKQRDALVAHIMDSQNFEDENALYAHYLIDFEMSACAITSRIKQAISSVQLFVQRILMGLENIPANANKLIFPDGEIDYWQWIKHYRIWEANRKVFLFPENWIEPELRLEKSEFFQEMENQLLQGEITTDNLELAYLNYLEKLDDVGNLEITGMYGDVEQHILHVFGRTRGHPHFHFYRRWVCESYWTPWEKMELEIEGNHLIPVVYNRRLYLFWPRFIDASTPVQTEGQIPVKYTKIHMLYSEYKSDKWSSTKLSKKFITVERPAEWHYTDEMIRKRFFFSPIIDKDELYIRCGYYLDWEHDWDTTSSDIPPDSELFDNVVFEGGNVPDIIDIINRYYMIQSTFKLNNCNDDLEIIYHSTPSPLKPQEYARPSDCIPEYMNFRGPLSDIEKDGLPQTLPYKPDLLLPVELGPPPKDSSIDYQEIIYHKVLDEVPEQFSIAYPHIYRNAEFFAQNPFFYQGKNRSFFVMPKDQTYFYVSGQGAGLSKASDYLQIKDHTNFELIDMMNHTYWQSNDDKFGPQLSDESNEYIDIDVVKRAAPKALVASTYYGLSQQQMVLDRNTQFSTRMGDFAGFTTPYTVAKANPTEIQKIVTDQSSIEATYFRVPTYKEYRFMTFHHPFVCNFIKVLKKEGLPGLLGPTSDSDGWYFIRQKQEIDYFKNAYKPTWRVDNNYPVDDIDFSFEGAYSIYNWELFFHAPLLIASRMSQNQKFEEAQKWFHYIFNPTESTGNVPDRFWKIKPFFKMASKALEDIKKLLADGNLELEKQIAMWEQNPFQPHAIARLRIVAYMKTTVMKYLDNLIAWGDHLFRRDTIESINEASQLYILASEILGRRPVMTDKKDTSELTFNDLLTQFDLLADQQINLEGAFAASSSSCLGNPSSGLSVLSSILYFCVPHNKKLLQYWDIVADRLFKIRNCLNIEGIRRELPLFEPPIDPGLLVRAVAAGVDLNSILNDLYAPLPHYRFGYTLQKAVDICQEVKALGGALLLALEKRDAEKLVHLRSTHEVQLLRMNRDIKRQTIKEAQETLSSLKLSRELSTIRLTDYSKRKPISQKERASLNHLKNSNTLLRNAFSAESIGKILHLTPDTSTGLAAAVTFGGRHLGNQANTIASGYQYQSQTESFFANRASSTSAYERRQEDWNLQKKLAEQEIKEIDKRIAAAEIRLALAQKDQEINEQQTEYASEVETFMRQKYTNQQLYDWLLSQLSSLYFQSYQMAYDLAKRAEKSFRHELAMENASFIQFGYWDNLKKGLLSGERLLKGS